MSRFPCAAFFWGRRGWELFLALQWWRRNILGELCQYQGWWLPGSMRRQEGFNLAVSFRYREKYIFLQKFFSMLADRSVNNGSFLHYKGPMWNSINGLNLGSYLLLSEAKPAHFIELVRQLGSIDAETSVKFQSGIINLNLDVYPSYAIFFPKNYWQVFTISIIPPLCHDTYSWHTATLDYFN